MTKLTKETYCKSGHVGRGAFFAQVGVLKNWREWPGEGIHIAECAQCGSTLAQNEKIEK